MAMHLLWSSLLLWLIISISLLPDGCNGVRNIRGIEENVGFGQIISLSHQQQGESSNTGAIVHGIEAARGDYSSLAKIVEQIKKEVRLMQYEENNIMFLENPVQRKQQNEKDKSSMTEVANILEQMSNEWKENMDNLIKIGQKKKNDEFFKLFKDALIAIIAFNRFTEIFAETRDQEIDFKKSMQSPHSALKRFNSMNERTVISGSRLAVQRFNSWNDKTRINPYIESMSARKGISPQTLMHLDSFNKKTEFEKDCAHKILAIFTLADIKEKDLLKRMSLTIEIVENAVKFYETIQNYQEIEEIVAIQKGQMKIFKLWLKKKQRNVGIMHKDNLAGGMKKHIAEEIFGNNIFKALVHEFDTPFVVLHETVKKGQIPLYTILKGSDIMQYEMGEEKLKILIIYNESQFPKVELKEIVEKLQAETEEDLNDEHKIIFKIIQPFLAANIAVKNAAVRETDFPVIEEMAEYFKKLPYEWKAMLAKLLEYALIAKITFNRFLKVYDEYVDLDKIKDDEYNIDLDKMKDDEIIDLDKKKVKEEQMKIELTKKILTIFAFFQTHISGSENNLEHQFYSTIQNLLNAIKFYEILREMFNFEIERIQFEIEKIQEQKSKESKLIYLEHKKKEKKKERNEMEKRMKQMFIFKTWLVEKVSKIIETGKKTDEEMLKIGKKILESLIAIIRKFEAENAKRLKNHSERTSSTYQGDEPSGSNQHDHHLIEHVVDQQQKKKNDDKGKQKV